MLSSKYFNIYNNNFFLEPLEQFEVTKVGYEFWYNNGFFYSLVQFFKNLNNNDTADINAGSEVYLDNSSIILLSSKNFLLPSFNFENINISYDFFDSYIWQPELNFNPLFWGIDFNSTIYFFILLVLILSILFLPITNNLLLIPNGWQLFLENLYKFVGEMLEGQVGKEAQKFFPYVFSIFIFILGSNMLGMTMFSFTLTSHIMVTFTLGVSTFIGLTILGFVIQHLHFLNLFLPKGIPAALIPMLVVIEIISYFSRALSLSIRLFANLMSGHTLLHILAFFSSKLFKYKFIVGLISFILILAIVALEFCIAILQAYVFAILICIYLNDSFHASH
jgi:ATP synthase subunit 6